MLSWRKGVPPLHLVALSLWRKTVEAMRLGNLCPLIIRLLLVLLVMSVVAVDLRSPVSDYPLSCLSSPHTKLPNFPQACLRTFLVVYDVDQGQSAYFLWIMPTLRSCRASERW